MVGVVCIVAMLNTQTGFQRDLLVIVAGLEKPSGQDIKREYESGTRTSITHGRLYPNLDTLVEEGYIAKGSSDQRTNFYEITDSGEQMIKEQKQWEREYIDAQPVEA